MPEIAGDMEGIKRAWLKLRGREAHPTPTFEEPNPSKFDNGDPRAVLLRPPAPAPAPEAPKAAAPAAEPEAKPDFYKGKLGRPYDPRSTDVQRDADGRWITGHPDRKFFHVEGLPPGWHLTEIRQLLAPHERWLVVLKNPNMLWTVEMTAATLAEAKLAACGEAWSLHRYRRPMLTDPTGYRGNRLLARPPSTVDEWTEADERRRQLLARGPETVRTEAGLSLHEGEE